MKKSIVHLVFLALSFNAPAQNEGEDILLSVSFEKDTYGFYEPWHFSIEVKNTKEEEINFLAPFVLNGNETISGVFSLELKNSVTPLWKKLNTITNSCNPLENIFVKIAPNQKLSYFFSSFPPSSLLMPGLNDVRVYYSQFCNEKDTSRIHSSVCSIFVEENKREDIKLSSYLAKVKNPDFFLYPLVHIDYDTADINYALFVLNEYPNSSYIDFVHLYLSKIYIIKAFLSLKGSEPEEKSLHFLRLSKKYGQLSIQSSNLRIVNLARFQLNSLYEVATRVYKKNVPDEIGSEFYMINKK